MNVGNIETSRVLDICIVCEFYESPGSTRAADARARGPGLKSSRLEFHGFPCWCPVTSLTNEASRCIQHSM